MKADINAARGEILDVVSKTVSETFSSMFGQNIASDAKLLPAAMPNDVVLTCVKLNHGETEADFCFRFEMKLLMQAAGSIFTPEYLAANAVLGELGCEIANIVCTRVKTYLNGEGYYTNMGFPFVPGQGQPVLAEQGDVVHMHFFYRDKDGKQGVGITVNFAVN